MLVVNTTSATAGSGAAPGPPAIRPRKRVPSSRRRNPGSVTLVSAANLLLRWSRLRFLGLRSRRGRCCRCWFERDRGRGSRSWRRIGRLLTQPLLENRFRSGGVGGHYLQNEAKPEED